MKAITVKNNIIKCSDKNNTTSVAFFNMKLIRLPMTPGRAANAFLASSCSQLEILSKSRFTAFGGFGSGVEAGTLGLDDGKTDKIILEIVNLSSCLIRTNLVKPFLRY